ncbi:MAG: CDP-alcohol phosphatidyltransferase family protein [Proteobacteria bacterium]|nr:CDP-alcohol phosphatidyltransferase family protein [Pseudomonadota bacterium]MBU1585746.1 CDP-alcohol phosphatidyltransferase family protein [Pseudomonadota bacterium]MBU2453334.1 CDP-alcohol phosphatidyltransferase family protein [Pseudomonadota bacterium]MBU2628359.1 CDP-alcohol phosphatidyltransferase family protein [Pseudomonadota bacterium]
MKEEQKVLQRIAAVLVYGRAPLVFAGMVFAVGVMWTHSSTLYILGVICFLIAMCFDLVDRWFSVRFGKEFKLVSLADKMMDKVIYSIIFPLLTAGAMWRLLEVSPEYTRVELLHAILVLFLCIAVLIRDNFAHFMRGFSIRTDEKPEETEYARLRQIVAAPVGALLYIYIFFIPSSDPGIFYGWISKISHIPLRNLFFIEIFFLIFIFGSIAMNCRKYGSFCLDEICLGDVKLRRRILSIFPNALTLMNALMGLMAVFFAYQGKIREAYLLLVGGAVFDKVDGALARKLGLTTIIENKPRRFNITFGGIMDDIADAVSFCIAPGWIFYIFLSQIQNPVIQKLPLRFAAIAYILLGFTRLVYFTLDRNPIPGFFKGMPTPAAALLVTAPMIMLEIAVEKSTGMVAFWGIFSFCLMFLAAGAMNTYPVIYLHIGRFMDRRPWFARINLMVFLFSAFTPFFGYVALSYGTLYLLSPIVTRSIDPKDIGVKVSD